MTLLHQCHAHTPDMQTSPLNTAGTPFAERWPEPIPLQHIKQNLLTVRPLSINLVPEPYQAWLTDIAERMQCPLDYVAIGALIMTACVVGAGCGVRPKAKDSWTVIPNLWGGVVGPPSTLKSPALKEMLRPLEALEALAWKDYETGLGRYMVELDAYKAQKEVIRQGMQKAARTSAPLAFDLEKERLTTLKEPQAPRCKRYLTNDATIEKMHELLSHNPRGLLLFRDELMGFLASWEREGHERDRTFYLEAWNGDGTSVTDRIGRGTIRTENLCISLLGGTQPLKLLGYFQRVLGGLDNDGLLQRFQLLVYPDESLSWTLVDRLPDANAQRRVTNIISKLASGDFTAYGASQEAGSRVPFFRFSASAQESFYLWLQTLEERLRTSPDEPLLLEHLAKYRKLLPALALLFHLIDTADGNASGCTTGTSTGQPTGPISLVSLERAAAWCTYLESHARRIYGMGLSPGYQAARHLARKIQGKTLGASFDLRDVYRKEWAFLKTREEVAKACEILVDHGWLQTETSKSNRYRINPRLRSKST
jgi:putative DNA primase/helicase